MAPENGTAARGAPSAIPHPRPRGVLRRLPKTLPTLFLWAAAGCDAGAVRPLNRAPSPGTPIPSMELVEGQSVLVEMSSHFADPDGDTLAYEAATDAAAARVAVSGTLATVTAASAGSATLTVTARDPGGLAATQSTGVVVRPNRAPAAKDSIPAVTLVSGEIVPVRVAAYFADPEGGALSYRASSSNPRAVLASASGPTVSVSGVAAGTATLTVTATDPGGLAATHEVDATVVAGAPTGFRDDFDSGLATWDVEQADTAVSEGVLALTNRAAGIAGRMNRDLETPINFWEVRARLGRTRTDSVVASLIFATGDERYAWYALDVGSGVSVEGSDTNYRFYVLDRTRWPPANRWVVVAGAFGVSDAVRDGAGEFTEIAVSLEDGELRAGVGGTELFAATLSDEHPTRMTSVGLWVFPLDGAEARTALFDWVEATGTPTVGPASAAAPPASAYASRKPETAPGAR